MQLFNSVRNFINQFTSRPSEETTLLTLEPMKNTSNRHSTSQVSRKAAAPSSGRTGKLDPNFQEPKSRVSRSHAKGKGNMGRNVAQVADQKSKASDSQQKMKKTQSGSEIYSIDQLLGGSTRKPSQSTQPLQSKHVPSRNQRPLQESQVSRNSRNSSQVNIQSRGTTTLGKRLANQRTTGKSSTKEIEQRGRSSAISPRDRQKHDVRGSQSRVKQQAQPLRRETKTKVKRTLAEEKALLKAQIQGNQQKSSQKRPFQNTTKISNQVNSNSKSKQKVLTNVKRQFSPQKTSVTKQMDKRMVGHRVSNQRKETPPARSSSRPQRSSDKSHTGRSSSRQQTLNTVKKSQQKQNVFNVHRSQSKQAVKPNVASKQKEKMSPDMKKQVLRNIIQSTRKRDVQSNSKDTRSKSRGKPVAKISLKVKSTSNAKAVKKSVQPQNKYSKPHPTSSRQGKPQMKAEKKPLNASRITNQVQEKTQPSRSSRAERAHDRSLSRTKQQLSAAKQTDNKPMSSRQPPVTQQLKSKQQPKNKATSPAVRVKPSNNVPPSKPSASSMISRRNKNKRQNCSSHISSSPPKSISRSRNPQNLTHAKNHRNSSNSMMRREKIAYKRNPAQVEEEEESYYSDGDNVDYCDENDDDDGIYDDGDVQEVEGGQNGRHVDDYDEYVDAEDEEGEMEEGSQIYSDGSARRGEEFQDNNDDEEDGEYYDNDGSEQGSRTMSEDDQEDGDDVHEEDDGQEMLLEEYSEDDIEVEMPMTQPIRRKQRASSLDLGSNDDSNENLEDEYDEEYYRNSQRKKQSRGKNPKDQRTKSRSNKVASRDKPSSKQRSPQKQRTNKQKQVLDDSSQEEQENVEVEVESENISEEMFVVGQHQFHTQPNHSPHDDDEFEERSYCSEEDQAPMDQTVALSGQISNGTHDEMLDDEEDVGNDEEHQHIEEEDADLQEDFRGDDANDDDDQSMMTEEEKEVSDEEDQQEDLYSGRLRARNQKQYREVNVNQEDEYGQEDHVSEVDESMQEDEVIQPKQIEEHDENLLFGGSAKALNPKVQYREEPVNREEYMEVKRNTVQYSVIKEGVIHNENDQNRDITCSEEEASSQDKQITPQKHRSCASLVREMIQDVTNVRKNCRNLTPQNCRISFGLKHTESQKKDLLTLNEDQVQLQVICKDEIMPRFKSAKNTPYKDFERDMIRYWIDKKTQARAYERKLQVEQELARKQSQQQVPVRESHQITNPEEQPSLAFEDVEMLYPSSVRDVVEQNYPRESEQQLKLNAKKILNLHLPRVYRNLLQLFVLFENNMNFYKSRHGTWSLTLTQMVEMMVQSEKTFKESHFRQFITLVPDLFIHKWETKKGKMELFIEIPQNIQQMIQCYKENGYTENASENAYPFPLSDSLLNERRKILEERMYMETYKVYQKAKEELKKENEGLYNEIMDEDETNLKEWPEFFNPSKQIQKVAKASLKQMPSKLQKFKSTHDFLREYSEHNDAIPYAIPSNYERSKNERCDNNSAFDEEEESNILLESQKAATERDFEVLSQHGISEDVFNQIQQKHMKQEQIKQRNQAMLEKEEHSRQLQDHIRIAEQMRDIVLSKKKNKIFFDNLIQAIQEKSHSEFNSVAEIRAIIHGLSKILSKWFKLITLPQQSIVYFADSSKFPFVEIRRAIIEHFKKQKEQGEM